MVPVTAAIHTKGEARVIKIDLGDWSSYNSFFGNTCSRERVRDKLKQFGEWFDLGRECTAVFGDEAWQPASDAV